MKAFKRASLSSLALLALSLPAAADLALVDCGLFDGVRTEEALRRVVQVNADRGVDVIKTRSIERGTYLSEDSLRLMREKGAWFVPTLITMIEMNEEQYDHVLRLRGSHMVPRLEQAVRDAHRLGVKIATGADNYYDNESINRISLEVMHLARLGLSPFEALQAATVSAAELLGVGDRTGRIAPGYEADLVLVPGNPLQDVRALQDVLLVGSNGTVALKRIPFGLP